MDISLEKKNTTNASLKIKLNEADYKEKVDKKLKEYSKKAQIKGFRPGKVPISIIQKMYGNAIKAEEINHIINHSITDYVKDNQIKLLGSPLAKDQDEKEIDWNTQNEFEFEFELGLQEEFKYDLKKVKVTSYDIQIKDKDINEEIGFITKRFGKPNNPEISEADDSLYCEIKQEKTAFEHKGVIDISQISKKEQKKLIGLKKDDQLSLNLSKAVEDINVFAQIIGKTSEEAKDLKGDFDITILNINRTEPAVLDQELFDQVLGKDVVKSEEEFKSKIKESIKSRYEQDISSFTENEIREKLITTVKINLPDSFLKKWILNSNQGKVSADDIEKEYEAFAKETKWDIIKGKIAEDNDFKVEHEDVVNKAKDMVKNYFSMSGANIAQFGEEQIDSMAQNYLQGENGENYSKLYRQAETDKVLGFIKGQIQISKKKTDIEGYQAIVAKAQKS